MLGSSIFIFMNECCCCSVAKLRSTLCNPMDGSTPGFPVLHCLPEFAQTHVHSAGDDAIQPFHPLSSASPPALNLSHQQRGSFPMSQLFVSGQSIGASALAPVLPMNI